MLLIDNLTNLGLLKSDKMVYIDFTQERARYRLDREWEGWSISAIMPVVEIDGNSTRMLSDDQILDKYKGDLARAQFRDSLLRNPYRFELNFEKNKYDRKLLDYEFPKIVTDYQVVPVKSSDGRGIDGVKAVIHKTRVLPTPGNYLEEIYPKKDNLNKIILKK